ncbi:MAG: hypothetical protein HZC36_12920 [Armatimonadetes bacterium]|nr:hypothetical protein [Armatimonadota bacterium]
MRPASRFVIAISVAQVLALTVAALAGATSAIMLLFALVFTQQAALREPPLKVFRRHFGDRAFQIVCVMITIGMSISAFREALDLWEHKQAVDRSATVFVVLYCFLGVAVLFPNYFLLRGMKPLDPLELPCADIPKSTGQSR